MINSLPAISLEKTLMQLPNPDVKLDLLIESFAEGERSLTILPSEVWALIFKKFAWKDVKKAERTCKQIFLVAQRVFKQGRIDWASILPEINSWSIPKLIFEIETKTLYYKQSVFLTFARIIGPARFRGLPAFESEGELSNSGYVVKITPQQMTAPLMKGVTGQNREIQFLAIRYQIIPKSKDPHYRYLWDRLHLMVMIAKSDGNSFEMIPAGTNCFPNIAYSQQGSVARYDLLPKLLREGILDIKDEKFAKDHTWYARPHQVKLV